MEACEGDRAARGRRVRGRHRIDDGHLHRREHGDARIAAVSEQRSPGGDLRRAVQRTGPAVVPHDSGSPRIPAADHQLRDVRLVPVEQFQCDRAGRAAARQRRGGDASARGWPRRESRARTLVHRRARRRHLVCTVEAPRRRSADHRARDHARRPHADDHRRDAAAIRAAVFRTGDGGFSQRRLDLSRSARERSEPRGRSVLRVRAAQAGRHARASRRRREARRGGHRETRSDRPPVVHGARRRPARGERRRDPPDAAALVRRRRPAAAHHVRERRRIATGAIGRARARNGDACRARRRKRSARPSVLRRRALRVGRRRGGRHRPERGARATRRLDGVGVHPARRRHRD